MTKMFFFLGILFPLFSQAQIHQLIVKEDLAIPALAEEISVMGPVAMANEGCKLRFQSAKIDRVLEAGTPLEVAYKIKRNHSLKDYIQAYKQIEGVDLTGVVQTMVEFEKYIWEHNGLSKNYILPAIFDFELKTTADKSLILTCSLFEATYSIDFDEMYSVMQKHSKIVPDTQF